MKGIKLLLKAFAIALVIFSINACSGSNSEDRSPKEALSVFVRNNKTVVGFGSLNLKGILSKADYTNFPMVGKLIGTEIETLERLIDLDIPAYYAFEGPFDKDGSPEISYVFFRVKNSDSLVAELMSRGFDVEEKGPIKYSQDGDFAIGIKDHLAIAFTKKGEFDTKKIIKETFKQTKGDASDWKIDDILNQNGDIVIGMSISSLYESSDTDLSDLSKDKQKELKDLVKDSYIQTVVKFEEGAAIIETKNFFSEKLKDKMFFNSDQKAPIIARLGQGPARFGLSVNIDVKKVQGFIDDYSPGTLKKLAKAMGGPAQMALMASGKEGLSGLFDGKFGIVMLGDPDLYGGFEPDFNFFIGLGSKGHDLGNLAKEMLSYSMKNVYLDKDGISGFSNSEYIPAPSKRLSLPKGCENFGKSGISGFINFDGIDFDDMDLEGEQNILRVVKYATFDYNSDGGRVYIQAKEGKENVLKQAMDVLIKEFSSEISGIVI